MYKRAGKVKEMKKRTLVPSGSNFCEAVLWVPTGCSQRVAVNGVQSTGYNQRLTRTDMHLDDHSRSG